MNGNFKKGDVTYNFRKNSTFETRDIRSVYYGSETISFIGPKIWELLPSNIYDSENLNIFKLNINLGSLKTVHAAFAGYILQT